MEYSLKYGSGTVSFEIPEKNVRHFIEVNEAAVSGDNPSVLREAFDNPVEAPPLSEAVADRRVVLLVEDSTRAVEIEDVFDALTRHLGTAKFIQAIICTGTHDPNLPGNERIAAVLRRYLLARGIADFDIAVHDSRTGPFDDYGVTGFGNRLLVNPLIRQAQVFVVLSDMKNHYFAGYSNAVKNFLPGICAYETTERNHAMALRDEATFGHHPWHPDPSRRENPLAQEMVEGYQRIAGNRPAYVLATIQKSRKILWAEYGDLPAVTRRGMARVDQLMSQTVEPADLLIVSPGGYPNDESLYTAQRALELSKNAVKPGGEILFLAECRNGIGPPSAQENFYDLLSRPLPEVFRILHEKYVLYSHKAYKFARLIDRCGFLGMATNLEKSVVENIHLKWVKDPVQWVNARLRENPQLTVNLVNDGNKIALHARTGGAF